ncbi:DoxX-like protein [Isoptericola jiangsuensis]|uniref:DoxX-like protein n=1 Tax=Isoptericola jiangsuensis TaxID=548579 RepID=A0A2A9EY78_9MICO|nr:DoxX family membrane protein [Isoptericola jiangsuensis]PFG44014.1 DoxX-like protein [Isoptericola jiangsuensis]
MLLRRLARPLLAVPFVHDGLSAALRPTEHTDAAREGADLVTRTLGVDPLDDTQVSLLVRAHGIATVAAGVLLAVGRAPRTAALTLAALTAPLAAVNQPFTSKGEVRKEKTTKFVRNVGAVGAAVIAGIDLEGRPGVSYRIGQKRAAAGRSIEHAAERTKLRADAAASSAKKSAKHAAKDVRHAAGSARKDAKHAAGSARKDVRRAVAEAKASAGKAAAKLS